MDVLIVDNYDSFTFNLAQAVGSLVARVRVQRCDAIEVEEIALDRPAIIISPGPGVPQDAGRSVDVVARFSGQLPILGICLGHQAIGVAFGAHVAPAPSIVHGQTSQITHVGIELFEGCPTRFAATRYHSLVIDESSLSNSGLNIVARGEDGLLMAIAHRTHQTFGLQFHPESVLTQCGPRILENFLRIASESLC
jgi:anthranilate synthase/aminodeoxychorismate synthase-like glutamine amidotransferase